jgi:nitroimidazol reductase NimA-like FMN-containing flavoprotein (pyridoxamine 5'-phosphate oxidase superfamily)
MATADESMKGVPIELRGDFIVKMYDLEPDVCRQFLARCTFGRVAFGDETEGLTVLPVNCVFTGDGIRYPTQPGSPLDRLGDGRPVAFEADHVDPISESGWSVLVRGTAAAVTDPEQLAALADTSTHAWAPGAHDRWIEIQPQQITGRIIYRQRVVAEGERTPPGEELRGLPGG